MANVNFHPDAQQEYRAAVRWYRRQSPVAARRFVAEVDRVTDQIGKQPDFYGWYDHEFREAGVRRYPYTVVYRVEPSGDVVIVAVAHTSRQPGYWQGRV